MGVEVLGLREREQYVISDMRIGRFWASLLSKLSEACCMRGFEFGVGYVDITFAGSNVELTCVD